MTRGKAEPSQEAGQRLLAAARLLLIAGFVIAFGARRTIVLSNAGVDDALFMRLGRNLASGRWLGHYDVLTLAKGPGFPAFLAIANFLGLPYPMALALFHAACASFAAAVFGRLTRSRATGFAVLAALLLTPTLYNGDMLGVFRDFFYTSLTLALVASAVALVTGCFGRPAPMAALTGLLGAWFWLTREEGEWLLPCLALLLLIPLLGRGRAAPGAGARLERAARALAPAALAFGVAAALLVGFGLVNRAVYGRFVVNEIKDRAFQGAMSALQDASAPFHREGVPVPAAARARIYAVSPAFASIKEPILDGPLQADATQWGCKQDPKFCGDFGGGWFMWDLRNAAAAKGWHETPAKAAGFYATLAREVRQACAGGRLECRHWPVPFIPPIRANELGDVEASLGRVFHVFTFGEPVQLQGRASDLTAPWANTLVAFLNAPGVRAPTSRHHLSGWFVAKGDQWFTPAPGEGVTLIEFTRADSADLVRHFDDARLSRQRFTLTADCPTSGSCPVTLALEHGGVVPIDLATLAAGGQQVGGGTLWLDDAGRQAPEPLLKTRFSQAWLAVAASLNPVFRGLAALGFAAWLLQLGRALARRRVTTGLIVCTALLASVAARLVILSLIDALSFVAATHSYALPGIALLVLFSVLSLSEAIAGLRRREQP
jgi:hypothetical protein